MWKYFALAALVVALAFLYVSMRNPCSMQVKADFSDKHPDYTLLDTGASEGSPESVRCNVSFQKPDSEQVYEETWLYRYSRQGWRFSRILNAAGAE